MKPRLWNAIVVVTTVFFLAWFFHSTDYFISHHLIPVSFAVLASLWTVRTYNAYAAGKISKGRLYVSLVLAVVFMLIGFYMDSVDNSVLTSIF